MIAFWHKLHDLIYSILTQHNHYLNLPSTSSAWLNLIFSRTYQYWLFPLTCDSELPTELKSTSEIHCQQCRIHCSSRHRPSADSTCQLTIRSWNRVATLAEFPLHNFFGRKACGPKRSTTSQIPPRIWTIFKKRGGSGLKPLRMRRYPSREIVGVR